MFFFLNNLFLTLLQYIFVVILVRMIEEFERESAEIREWLTENWIEDFGLQSEATERDQAVVDQIGGLLGSTSDREQKVLHITQSLYEQLKSLAGFLGRMGEPLPLATSSLKSSPSRSSSTAAAAAAASDSPTRSKQKSKSKKKREKDKDSGIGDEHSSPPQESQIGNGSGGASGGGGVNGNGGGGGGGVDGVVKMNPNAILPPIHAKS